MKNLRDAATLAVLVLLALTVRVDLGGHPVELDVTPATEAGTLSAPPVSDTSAPVVRPHAAGFDVDAEAEATPPTSLRPVAIEAPLTPRRFVWEVNGRRFVIVVGGEVPAERPTSPEPAMPEPCGAGCEARQSC